MPHNIRDLPQSIQNFFQEIKDISVSSPKDQETSFQNIKEKEEKEEDATNLQNTAIRDFL